MEDNKASLRILFEILGELVKEREESSAKSRGDSEVIIDHKVPNSLGHAPLEDRATFTTYTQLNEWVIMRNLTNSPLMSH